MGAVPCSCAWPLWMGMGADTTGARGSLAFGTLGEKGRLWLFSKQNGAGTKRDGAAVVLYRIGGSPGNRAQDLLPTAVFSCRSGAGLLR